MGEKLEKQFVVLRRRSTGHPTNLNEFKCWKWFDARASARKFALDKIARSEEWQYRIDPVTRGPRA